MQLLSLKYRIKTIAMFIVKKISNSCKMMYKKRHIQYCFVFVFTFCGSMTILNIINANIMSTVFRFPSSKTSNHKTKPIVWIYHKNKQYGSLKNVFHVFVQLGYTFGDNASDWKILWAHDYPFKTLSKQLSHLKAYQRINHWPGIGFITTKVILATTIEKFIPKAFRLPNQKESFLHYSNQYPNELWVQKNINHRGIFIQKAQDIDLTHNDYFVQKYIDKPFLIDGYKFDIGIYTIITGIDPLRVYIVEDEMLLRFCPKKYYPFDPNITDKYVINDNYRPIWNIPLMKEIFNNEGFNFKASLSNYMHSNGIKFESVWKDMTSIIQQVYYNTEDKLIEYSAGYPSSNHFFELIRFDFILDQKLKVYLMEANMSPNLSSDHFPNNKQLYKHVIYTVLNLVGPHHYTAYDHANMNEIKFGMQKDQDYLDFCNQDMCSRFCSKHVCYLCQHCMSESVVHDIKLAYMEHTHRGAARRVIPPPINLTQAKQWDFRTTWPGIEIYNERNQLLYLWFIGMCRESETYCV